MSNPKRHHYVSQFILRNFADDGGRLYYFSRLWQQPEIRDSSPDGIFFERHLYSSIKKDGTKNPRLEQAYSQLEGMAQPLLEKIIESAHRRSKPKFSAQERVDLNKFLYHHIKRSPDFVGERDSLAEFDRLIEKATAEYLQTHSISDEERRELQKPVVRQRLMQNAKVVARSKGSAEVGIVFASRGLGVALVQNPKKSFVIGSYPYAQLSAPGIMGIPPGFVEMWFPIASDVAITFFGDPFTERLVALNDSGVRAINEKIALSSNTIAGRSEALVRSLSRLMAERRPSG
jgi:hypothetical protein